MLCYPRGLRISPDFMTTRTLVSIVTPAYNATRFIGETIRSVLAQTHGNWEMIVVDDCSSDGTCALVEQFVRQDARVRLVRQKSNAGPSAARDTALQAASGRYIAFLDSDDLWLSNKLENQLRFMNEVGAAISFTRFRRMNEGGTGEGHLVPIPDRLTYSQLLRNTAMATSTVLIDRGATGPFRMREIPCDDYALWLEIVKRGFAAYGLQEDLMRYRVVSSSFSRNKAKYAMKVWHTYRDLGLNLPFASWCFANYAARAWLKYRKF
jgi:teichuronic acid biosynthesis glycosyltransferase TuaG